jgi:very-short-patch-repair endonuclease
MKSLSKNILMCYPGFPAPTPEYKFHETRRWRFDYAFLDVKLAVELEGGIWTKGRHTRGKGFSNDMQKYNSASELGWTLLRYEPTKIDFDQIEKTYNRLKQFN